MNPFMTTLTETLNATIPGLTFEEIPAEECQMTYGANINHKETGMKFVVDCLKDWDNEHGGDMWEVWGQGKEDPEMFFITSTRDVNDLPEALRMTLANATSAALAHPTIPPQVTSSRNITYRVRPLGTSSGSFLALEIQLFKSSTLETRGVGQFFGTMKDLQPTVEELHYKNLPGVSKKRFHRAVAVLWEKRCQGRGQSWPPLLQDIQEALEEEEELGMNKTLESLYEEAFQKETKVRFDTAVHSLWEDHCKYRNPREWPPSLEEVKARMKELEPWP